jgi:chemotaxis signal transduction protein
VDRAFAIRRLTPIAGAPRPVRGVFSLNGRIVAAIDIGRLCGRDTAEDEPGAYGVLISGDGAECALLADAIVGLRQIAESDIERSESGVTDRVRVGLSNEGVSILSPANVLALSRAAGAHTRTRVEGGSD